MKRRKLERLIVEIIEDREALIRDEARLRGLPAGMLPPLDAFPSTVVWPVAPGGSTITRPFTASATVRCTCPPNRGDNYAGSCLIHDVHTTMTTRWQA